MKMPGAQYLQQQASAMQTMAALEEKWAAEGYTKLGPDSWQAPPGVGAEELLLEIRKWLDSE